MDQRQSARVVALARDGIRRDEELLADLGYKQEFKRAFRPIEVFGLAFSFIGIIPSSA